MEQSLATHFWKCRTAIDISRWPCCAPASLASTRQSANDVCRVGRDAALRQPRETVWQRNMDQTCS